MGKKEIRFVFSSYCNDFEKLQEDAKNYDYGIMWHTDYNGRSFTQSFPIINGRIRNAYLGDREDWRVIKIFDILEKELNKDPMNIFKVAGNNLPAEVKTRMFITDPIEAVRRGHLVIPKMIKLTEKKLWTEEVHWDSSFEQIYGTIISRYNFGCEVLTNDMEFDPSALGMACLLSAIKLSKKRECTNIIPESEKEEWDEILFQADEVMKKISWKEGDHEVRNEILYSLRYKEREYSRYDCPDPIKKII